MTAITHVRYTVKAEYAVQNQEYVKQVVDELRTLGRPDISYSVFVEDDRRTFIHLLFCANEEAERAFGRLQSQQVFQAALQESRPEGPTPMTNLSLVSSTSNLP